VAGITTALDVSAGTPFACARLTDETVKCWGDNSAGELGDGTTTSHLTAAAVPGLAGVAQVSKGGQFACARLFDGRVLCWGDNLEGQLGDGTTTQRLTPTPVLL
jgi:alpha-tubulin suppressor-like RCC1 family protein